MKREEAISELSVIWERLSHPEDCENGCYSFRDGNYLEAIDMAIEALKEQEISNELQEYAYECGYEHFFHECQNCEYRYYETEDDTDYCAWGEESEVEE